MASESLDLLIFGGPNSGKTNYGAQLLTRLESHSGRLALRAQPTSARIFWDAKEAIGEGRAAAHTSVETYVVQPFSIYDEKTGVEATLVWADYGGEQLSFRIVRSRKVPAEWRDRIRMGDGWFLVARLSLFDEMPNLFSGAAAHSHGSGAVARKQSRSESPTPSGQFLEKDGDSVDALSGEVELIELLQILRYVRHREAKQDAPVPLVVLLTCWDELDVEEGAVPLGVWRARAPMLASFVDANWGTHYTAFGVSALEKPLSPATPDPAIASRPSETVGYVICEDGARSSDLTLPVAAMMRLISKLK